jgi:hypothetical protein
MESDFTAAEIIAGIKGFKNSSTVGTLDRVFLSFAPATVALALAALFNAMRRAGRILPDMLRGTLTLVMKKRRRCARHLPHDHCVHPASQALFLAHRAPPHRVDRGVQPARADPYRLPLRPPRHDNALVLNALKERNSHARAPLYVAFVDFRKAFDSVPRTRLGAKLRARGVGPMMMRVLEATYVDVPLSVRTRAGVSLPFFSTRGLKQGDPNSPNLFGLYVDDLVILIEELGAAAALPTLGGRRIPPLHHADDLALVATTRAGASPSTCPRHR